MKQFFLILTVLFISNFGGLGQLLAAPGVVGNRDNFWNAPQTFKKGINVKSRLSIKSTSNAEFIKVDYDTSSLHLNSMRPIQDSTGISVFTTAGTGIAKFDAENIRFGINTLSPSATLEVAGTGGTIASFDGTAAAGIAVTWQTTGANIGWVGNGSTSFVGLTTTDFGINSQSILHLGTGGTSRLQMDSSGNIFTNSLSNALSVGGFPVSFIHGGDTDAKSSMTIFRGSGNSSGPVLAFGKSRGAWGTYTTATNGDVLGNILFAASDGTDYNSYAAQIVAQVDGTSGPNDTPGRLIFSTTADGAAAPSERMRIQADGTISIGKTADTTPALDVNGHVHATQFVTTSDQDLKKEVADLSCDLSQFKAIKSKSWKWKDSEKDFSEDQKAKLLAVYGERKVKKTRTIEIDGEDVEEEYEEGTGEPDFEAVAKDKGGTKTGFLAQDFEGTAYQNCVVELDGGAKGLDYACISAYQWEIMQALLGRIEALEQK